MQLQITAEEVFDEYKRNIAELQHELTISNIKVKKLVEIVEGYERAEADRVRVAAASRNAVIEASRATEKSVQPIPMPPVPTYSPIPSEGPPED